MSRLIDPARTGLAVIDVQERLWPFMHGRFEVGRRILQAVRTAGRLEVPLLVTEQYVRGLGSTIGEVRTALEAIGAYRPIEKRAFSCFGEPAFAAAVEQAGLTGLAIAGIEAHICVLQTALEALDRGLRVVYLAEATGSRDPAHKQEAVERVRAAGGIIASVEMFVFEMMRSSDHPRFREVQKIIL